MSLIIRNANSLHWLFACPNTYICNNLLTSQLDIKVGTSTTGNLEVHSPSWTLTRLKPCDALSIFQTRVLEGIMLNVQRVHEPADGTYVLRIYSSFSSSDNRRTAMVTPPPTPFNELAERPPIEFPVVNDFLESNRAARTPAGAGVIDMSDFLLFSSPPDIDIDYFSTIGRGTSRSSSASSSDGAVPSSNESPYTPTLSPASSWSTLEEPVPNRFQLGDYAPAAPMESDSFNAQESAHCVLQDADFSHCTNAWFTPTGSNGRESALTTESSKIPSTSSYFPREPSPGSDSSVFAPTALSTPNPYTTQHSFQPTLPSSAPSPDPHLDSDYDQDNNDASETSGGSCKRRGHFPCLHPSCPRVLTSPYTRSVHMTTHRRAKVRKEFLCTFDGCGEAFTRRHDRARHEVALHGKECAHTCEKCRRFFSSARMLERHACRGRRRDVGNGL